MFKGFFVYNKKKIFIFSIFMLVIIFAFFSYVLLFNNEETVTCSFKEKEYYVGGEAVGIKLLASGVLVMGVDRDDCDLKIGDIILEVNGQKIETDSNLQEYASTGKMLSLTVLRQDKNINVNIEPKYNETTGEYRLGLWVKDSSAGVGTITFYEKDSAKFAALGHAITETAEQYILPITTGGITTTEIYSIKKGAPNSPGELKGTVSNTTLGQIYCNTKNGVFGHIDNKDLYSNNEIIQLADKEEIKTGDAYIYATLDDNVKKKYNIQIEKIFLNSTGNKNIAIKITDQDLLEKTGGIVQGMSGAPIIQNGKLVGAITHVFLDDPQRGYGAFIENMVNDMNTLNQ